MAGLQTEYLALLRGINVGGKNVIGKEDLRSCFENMGFENVQTYIQSGNILFRSRKATVTKLTKEVEAGLTAGFSYDAQAVVMSREQYATALKAAPKSWGNDNDWKHNAMFLLGNATPEGVLDQLPPPKKAIERVATGPGVIFWSTTKKDASKSSMMKLSKAPAYQQMTVRNHNTAFKLLQLLEVR